MVYYIATVSFLLLLTVDALELDEITYLPSTYWPMLRYAPSSSSPSSSPLSSARGLNVPFKRQGIIPGPRVGRSFDSNHYYRYHPNGVSNQNDKLNEYPNVNNYHPELHEVLSSSGFNSRGKRSIRVNDISSSASPSASSSSPSSPSSLTGSNVDMSNLDDTSSSNSMAFFARSARQLIPAPRVGRSSSLSSSPLSNNLIFSPIPTSLSKSNLLTGFSHAASTYNRGEDEINGYETDPQIVNGQVGPLGAHGSIQLMAVPRGYLNPLLARDLFKRVALTPRIGRSSEGSSSSIGSNGWFDDDDYYNRVIKSSFTPRVGRSVNINGEKSSLKTSKS
ncbi:uncharacterized protein LOC128386028 [Panonychus citri]|uniref:uncharacterized protein LOC128386028 n=1 Tax=Panonychus citri TaxID=50023 RepID=UPI0023081656|nr:uncharacterized protein LOC128386028 [Panonychus citri]